MIGYLKGTVLSISADCALILVGGVGYEVYCSAAAFSKMEEGKICEVYTYLQVSEQNGVQLFGFADVREKALFLKLLTVSGVGPKMGLSVLAYMSAADVVAAIATGDVKALSRVKGLGKKTAERIILELKDGMPKSAGAVGVGGAATPIARSEDEDAIVALTSLGFSRAEAERAVASAKANGAHTVEEIIMQALKSF